MLSRWMGIAGHQRAYELGKPLGKTIMPDLDSLSRNVVRIDRIEIIYHDRLVLPRSRSLKYLSPRYTSQSSLGMEGPGEKYLLVNCVCREAIPEISFK